ncbi:MAG: protein kinase [Hyphomicrobiaceae bacterium]
MDYRQVLQTGTVLDGKYRIERVIGSGGFGITYEAFDIGLAAPVAIKEYYPSQFGVRDATYSVRPRSERDREIFDRLLSSFLREARTLNQFEHPAIVRVLSVFEGYGTAYMVMKYETGPSLKAWLADLVRLPTQSELDRLVPPLLDSLEMMHNADFLHRDIAPDNIIVRSDGSPVLLDFGASRRVMGEMTGTLTGVVKKGYSPQEQYATDSRSQGPWTDIYALGATLYRCISGETPHEATERMLDDHLLPAVEAGAGRYRHEFLAAIDAAIVLRPRERPASIAIWREMLYEGMLAPPGQPQSWPAVGRTGSDDGAAAGGETRHWDSSGASGSQPRSGPRSTPSLRQSGSSRPGPQSQSSPSGYRSAPSGGFGAPADGPQSDSPPSQSTPTPKRRNMSAIAMVVGAIAIIGGGGLVLAMRVREPLLQTEDAKRIAAQKAADEAQKRQNEQLARLEREVAAARAEAERRRQQTEEEDRQRRQADADLLRRQEEAERLRKQAEEADRQQKQAEADRLRQQAEEAERKRRQAEDAERERQRQEAEAERLRQLEATRRAEAERERQRQAAETERQRQLEATRLAEAERQRQQAEETLKRSLAARPRQLAYSAPGATGTFPVAVQTNARMIVAGGSDGGLRAWDAATGAPREFSGTKHTDSISSMAVSPDDQLVVTGAWGGEIILWSLTGTAQRFRAADAGDSKTPGRRWVVATQFISPTRFVSVLSDGTTQTWDTRSPGAAIAEVRLNATGIKAADISRNGSTIATGTDAGALTLFRTSDGQQTRQLTAHRDWILALAIAWNVDLMASGSADGIVRIQSTKNTGQPREIQAHTTAVRAITFSADGTRLATGGDDGTVTVWDPASGSQLATYKDHRSSVRSLMLSPDGMRLVSASEDGDVRVWYLDSLVQASARGGPNTQR